MLSPSASVGTSKSGAVTNESAPVAASIANIAASAPPLMLKVSVDAASGSVAVTVVTAVVFSAIDTAAAAPPPLEVMTGASLTLVTVTAIACVSMRLPSETWTITS